MSELIVCGTDFSPLAEGALEWAAALAKRTGGHIDLVHVTPGDTSAALASTFDTARLDAEVARRSTERLREAARAAASRFDVSVRPQLLRGVPHEEIAKHAGAEDARMIVLGASGLALIERLLLGSVADRTVRSADRPVVLVPGAPEPRVWSADAARPPRIVAGLGAADDRELVAFVGDLRRGGPADVAFVHLYWPIGEYERLGLKGSRELMTPDPEVVKSLEPELRAKITLLPGTGTVSLDVRPAWGEPASNLLVAVEEREADLLVVGAHERHGLARLVRGSMARRLARHSRYVPIAVVPATLHAPTPAARAIPRVRSVLAATDLSPAGNAGVAHAYSLLRGTGGTVELCHVHEHSLPNPAYAYDRPDRNLTDIERARLTAELRALIPPNAESLGITTHLTIVDGGRAGEAVVQAAERLNVDVICLASRGRSGLARAVLGSVAQDVVHRARRPVFVVRDREAT
jgi:nucleotide-binding universal stress UspA family protein